MVTSSGSLNAEPPYTIQSEQKAHPLIVNAIQAMEVALKDLDASSSDMGHYKTNAIRDTRMAIHTLKKALYYRLSLDDAAIDKVK